MLNLSSIFSHEASIESLVIQFEANYQAALKQGLDIYFGVGYATNEDSQSVQAYLVKDNEIYKKHYWSWEYPRTPHKLEKTKAEHRHWLNLADVRNAALEANITNEADLQTVLKRSFATI